jgi:type IV secretion system protein VirD4
MMKKLLISLESQRRVIFHTAKEMVIAIATAGAVTYSIVLANSWGSTWQHTSIAAGILLLAGVLVLLRMELRFLRRHGFRIFNSGGGTLEAITERKVGGFMSLWDLVFRHGWRPERADIFLGRISPSQLLFRFWPRRKVGVGGDRHLLTISPNRSGKGASCIIPNLLFYPGSCVVLDPKGENAMVTAARRGKGSHQVTSSLGQDVYLIDPEGIVVPPPGAQLHRASWNPLAEYSPSDSNFLHALEGLLYIIIPANDQVPDPFFDNTARALLKAIILHVYSVEPPDQQTLVTVRRLITAGDNEARQYLAAEAKAQGLSWDQDLTDQEALLDLMRQNTDFQGMIAATASNVDSYPDVTKGGIWAVLREKTSFVDSLVQVLGKSDFSVADIIRKPTTVYLCIRATSLTTSMASLMRIFIEAAIKRFEDFQHERREHPVLLILDEFHSLGRMEAMNKAMGLVAGFGVRIWPFVQSLSQLKDYYPQTYQLFLTACETVQIFGDQDPEVLTLLSHRIGQNHPDAHAPKQAARGNHPDPAGVDEIAPLKALTSGMLARERERQIVLFNQDSPAFLERLNYYRHFRKNLYDMPPKYGP